MNTAPLKPAATVLLVKEYTNQPPQFFMVLRHHQIDVASGALVFPGGKVESQDNDTQLLDCLPQHHLANHLLPFAVAIIREAFEETGVLFARAAGKRNLLNANKLLHLQHYREKLVKEEITISAMAKKEGLELAVDELWHFAHWITPEMAPKRFDTHFFIAKAPSDQIALHDGEESVDSIWLDAQTLLQEAEQGKWKLVFPTRMNIEKLARFKSFDEIKNYLRQQSVVTVQPQYMKLDDGKFLCIPEEADYPQSKVAIEKVMNP